MPNHVLPVILSTNVSADPKSDSKVKTLTLKDMMILSICMFQVSSSLTDELNIINQKLRECEEISRVERVIDLQSKGSQTDPSSYDSQNDWHETFLSDNDLKLAKIQVIELESNSKKEEVIKKGLLEKVS